MYMMVYLFDTDAYIVGNVYDGIYIYIYIKNGQQNPDRPKLQDATPPTHSSRPALDTMSIFSSSFTAFALHKPA